jgi:alginate O-acetyltransferase complex protein AlgJ
MTEGADTVPRSLLLALLLTTGCPTGGVQGGFPWPLDPSKRQGGLDAAEVKELDRGSRDSSRAMIRRVARPTRANLDLAAYAANPILHRLAPEGVEVRPGKAVVDRAKLFGGVVVVESIVASLDRTPLTGPERTHPMAFEPLVDYLARWSADEAGGLEDARSAVKAETWGLTKRPGTFFQQIALLYLHRPAGGGAAQLWVKIEFEPWARLFEQMPDADGDGYAEIYGRLRPDLAGAEVVERIVEDYAGRVLATREVHAWANELASYWYPSYNTDVAPLGQATAWPLESTEAEVKASLPGLSVKEPTILIRGKPHNRAVYNVFVIPGVAPLATKVKAGARGGADRELKAVPVAAEMGPQRERLRDELKRLGGGSYAAWAKKVAPLHARIKRQLARRPKELKSVLGTGGFIFYRRSLDYVVGGEIQAQKPGKNPFATIVDFKDYLARLGVDFLLVPVPTKSEVFPDKLRGTKLRPARLPVLNPYGRKFLAELTGAGVEVVDLLPAYLAARGARKAGEEPLYQPQDTHWTDRGLRLAARLIGERIRRYAWYDRLIAGGKRAVAFTLKEVTFKRYGDLHSRLAEKEQKRFRPARLVGHRVIDPRTGKPYDDDPASPVVMLGDSFTGVYQRTDCESAGISAHVAHQIRYPVDLVMSYGGGPNVRKKLLRRGEQDLAGKRLLIWLFAARDFYNYWEDWAPLKKKDKKDKKKATAGSGR